MTYLLFLFLGLFQLHLHKTLEGKAQGTTYKIRYDSDLNLDFKVDSIFKSIDQSVSLWDSNSTLIHINKNTFKGKANADIIKLFKLSEIVKKNTDGYFDVSVAPLLAANGFGPNKNLISNPESLKYLIGKIKVLDSGKVIKKENDAALDFNAIAQGYTVDLIAEMLEKHKIKNYLVEIGGEIRASGKNEKNNHWQIGIEDPHDEYQNKYVIGLNNFSIATSGSYQNFKIIKGKKVSHVFDPKTGKAANHNMLSVTVKHKSAAMADAYATAFMAMGLEKTKKIAKKLKIDFLAIYEKQDNLLVYKSLGF